MAAIQEPKGHNTKPDISFVENASQEEFDNAYVLQPTGKPPKKSALERRLVMKQDFLLVPLLALTYFVTYLVSPQQI
jgi:hypothetical protein